MTAMRRILEDADLRSRLGAAAAATIAEHHGVEALARTVVQRLDERIERPAQRSWLPPGRSPGQLPGPER